ncbi:FAD/NAD(P)-binding domain-containing protein [Panus rudis PR-1116 ss-1]|nr:FAD/NAD(P)-binding domain-containing protein [Panus rudis PR-1116 ss-1]
MKVAIVGSGVSGLAATWLLNEFSDHEVHLYEADDRPGGHANTVTYKPPGKEETVEVDTGFIVFNPATYPNFIAFLNSYPHLRASILPTEMTFSVSRDKGLFEWAGNNLMTVFTQPSRLLDTKMWRLIYDVLRFNACARRLVMEKKGGEGGDDISIGDYLEREGYSDAFRDNYLIPMTAAIWSTPPDKCALDFPARTLIQFMNNHHLLQITGKPKWLTLRGGSRVYVKQILSTLPQAQLHLSTPIDSISTSPSTSNKIELKTASGNIETFDRVILACHSDTALSILKRGQGLTTEEERILGKFKWNRNEAVLHSDVNLMPKSRLAWSCWNYLTSSAVDEKGRRKPNVDQVALTYWMNDLQHLPEKRHGPVLVTLNPPFEPAEDKFGGRYKYDHPVLDADAIQAQREISAIQNTRGIAYAGAWLKYGFHEDGFTSGLRAALGLFPDDNKERPSIRPPFKVQSAEREPKPVLVAPLFDILEGTGLRALLGTILAIWVGLIRRVFEIAFMLDLSHLDQ